MDVTVGITSYNQRDYLVEAIDSVLAQSAPPDEVIIVDDAVSYTHLTLPTSDLV